MPTIHVSRGAIALLFLVTGCAGRSASVPSTVLAAADPSAPETPYTQPAEPMGGEKPRTLELEIQTKPAGDGGMKGMDGMEGMEGMDHSQHGGATGASSPQPTAKPAATPTPAPSEATVYTCPMHPEIRESKPGKCPKCGMKLVPAEKKKETEKAAPPAKPAATAAPKASPEATAKPSGHEGHGGTP